ncbi:17430_t:CDS:1, partial [Entrophospora sp. SA101]
LLVNQELSLECDDGDEDVNVLKESDIEKFLGLIMVDVDVDDDGEIKILVEDNDFNQSRISDSPIELPKLPKILVNKNLSINFERFSLFRNAPGCIEKDGYYYDDNNRNLNGNGDSNNRVTNVYL